MFVDWLHDQRANEAVSFDIGEGCINSSRVVPDGIHQLSLQHEAANDAANNVSVIWIEECLLFQLPLKHFQRETILEILLHM